MDIKYLSIYTLVLNIHIAIDSIHEILFSILVIGRAYRNKLILCLSKIIILSIIVFLIQHNNLYIYTYLLITV